MGPGAEKRVVGFVTFLGTLLYIPYLGSVGLWDPWETHYGEVARSMIQRNDYVFPYWENAWFFSKPVLTMWLQALGMQVVGTNHTSGAVGLYTEWGLRMPFALLSILALSLITLALCRTVNRRTGLAVGVVLATMPLFFLLTRQAVTDTPFVDCLICAMACALIGQLDPTTSSRSAWWYGFYAFCAFATLAKGLMGFALPAVILSAYAGLCLFPWSASNLLHHLRWLRHRKGPPPWLWAQCYQMRLGTGILVFLAIAAPWYVVMCLFRGVDDEGKLFWWRFLVHDHLNRLLVGVHTTTPGGTFTYFLEQGGFALFPWVLLVPGAFTMVMAQGLKPKSPRDQVAAIGLLWTLTTFALMASSTTKFHHYVFPILPGVAILIALFIDKLLDEGVVPHAFSLLLGVILFSLVGRDLATNPKNFTDLFVYNYERPYPAFLTTRSVVFGYNLKDILATVFTGFAVVGCIAALLRRQRAVVATLSTLALGFALWFNWSHWVDLSHHWTQRDLFWRYYADRKEGEPIAAYQMNWRGETFYSRNQVKQITLPPRLNQYASLPGRKWALVEHARLPDLRIAVGASHPVTVIERGNNNKFALVVID